MPHRLLILCTLLYSFASFGQFYCAKAVADFFGLPDHGLSTVQYRYLGSFKDVNGAEFHEYWVLQTFPFKPGFVTKKFFRHITQRKLAASPAIDLPDHWSLVHPFVFFAIDKYGPRRGWPPETVAFYEAVGRAYDIDSTYVWVENVVTHEIVGTLRTITSPYAVDPQGAIVADGPLVRALYGVVGEFRQPLVRTPQGIQCRALSPEERRFPPAYIPQEFLLQIQFPRRDLIGMVGEVGCFAAEHSLEPIFRNETIHELWMQHSRAFHENSSPLSTRFYTAADRLTVPVFAQWHGLTACTDFTPEPGVVCQDGKVLAEDRLWTPMQITHESLADHNHKIAKGEHRAFDATSALARRSEVFTGGPPAFDGVYLGDFSAIFTILQTTSDRWLAASASGQFVLQFEYLLELPKGVQRLKEQSASILEGLTKLFHSSDPTISSRGAFLINFILLKRNAAFFPVQPQLLPLLGKVLLSEDLFAQDSSLNELYEITNPEHIPWPTPKGPLAQQFAEMRKKFRNFLTTPPEIHGDLIDFSRVNRFKIELQVALIHRRSELTPELLIEIIAHALATENTTEGEE